jgi:hypothetical protein
LRTRRQSREETREEDVTTVEEDSAFASDVSRMADSYEDGPGNLSHLKGPSALNEAHYQTQLIEEMEPSDGDDETGQANDFQGFEGCTVRI